GGPAPRRAESSRALSLMPALSSPFRAYESGRGSVARIAYPCESGSVSLAPIPGILGVGAASGSAVVTASDSAIAGVGIAGGGLRGYPAGCGGMGCGRGIQPGFRAATRSILELSDLVDVLEAGRIRMYECPGCRGERTVRCV